MKIALFSGSHARHLFVHQALLRTGHDVLAVVMNRGSPLVKAPDGLSAHDAGNFDRHFMDRLDVETRTFGTLTATDVFGVDSFTACSTQNLNSPEIAEQIRRFDPDFAFIFGTDLLRPPLLEALPPLSINLHLGLSPWYRGAATLFWPFYFLRPQYAGATFHKITSAPDAGDILHQTVPSLTAGDGIHDVGANTVVAAARDLVTVIGLLSAGEALRFAPQRSAGKLFLERDFQAQHLRVIYDLYQNRIVDEWLSGRLGTTQPKIVRFVDLH
jgi:methionyl-tRNA formyltransferase